MKNKSKLGITFLGEATFIVALLTFAGFFVSYLYKFIYFRTLSIPLMFIEVDINRILYSTFYVVFVFFIVVLMGLFISAAFIIVKKYPKKISSYISSVFLIIISYIILSGKIFDFFVTNNVNMSAIGIIALLASPFVVLNIMNICNLPKMEEVFTLLELKPLLIFLIIFLLFPICEKGYKDAKREYFLVYKSDPELVILEEYKNKFIAAEFDRENKILKKEFILLDYTTNNINEQKKFEMEKVGPLQVE